MRSHRMSALFAVISLGLAGVVACNRDLTSPSTRGTVRPAGARASVSTTSPTFLQPAPDAPSIANPAIAFYAKKGQDQIARMYYQAQPGARDSIIFAAFRVRASSLASMPDGTPISDGDSVLITMTLVDATNGIIEFQPSGLQFSKKNPATLKISFVEANHDLNNDGVVNQLDTTLERQLAIWRRESPFDPWTRLVSSVSLAASEVETSIVGFSGYAIAY